MTKNSLCTYVADSCGLFKNSLKKVVFGHLKKKKNENILVCVEFLYMLCL